MCAQIFSNAPTALETSVAASCPAGVAAIGIGCLGLRGSSLPTRCAAVVIGLGLIAWGWQQYAGIFAPPVIEMSTSVVF